MTPLTRYTIVTGNTFTRSIGDYLPAAGYDIFAVMPVIFTANVLEDTAPTLFHSPDSQVHDNIYRRLRSSTTAGKTVELTDVYGGRTLKADGDGFSNGGRIRPVNRLLGMSAYPRAVSRTAGRNLILAPGMGSRYFTVVSNTAGAVAVTIRVLASTPGVDDTTVTLTSGVDFTLGSDNTATQLNVTAKNLAQAIYNTSIIGGDQIIPTAIAENVFLTKMSDIVDVTISSNQTARIDVFNGNNGIVELWRAKLSDTSTTAAVAGAAELNTQSGTITSEALTTAAGADYVLTLTNSLISATSKIFASVDNGTNTTEGMAVNRVTPGSGSVVIRIRNTHAADALNGTIKISFAVF
jgi:hypothetical protein